MIRLKKESPDLVGGLYSWIASNVLISHSLTVTFVQKKIVHLANEGIYKYV